MKVQAVTFCAYDIRALQACRKTILHLPLERSFTDPVQPQDLLWVREAAYICRGGINNPPGFAPAVGRGSVGYESSLDSDGHCAARQLRIRLTPASKMPRFASRFTLLVKAVREISLDQMSELEARRSGIWFDGRHYRGGHHSVRGTLNRHGSALAAFRDQWASLYTNTDYSLHRNPPILRVGFTAIAQNVDAYLASIEPGAAPMPRPG